MSRVLLRTLYLSEPGTCAKLQNHAIGIESPNGEETALALHEIDSLVVFGGCNASQPLVLALASMGKPTSYLAEDGSFQARLSGPESGGIQLRLAQYQAVAEAPMRLHFAIQLVRSKLQSQVVELTARARTSRTASMLDVEQPVATLNALREQCLRARDAQTLLQLEAGGAICYYGSLAGFLSSSGGFAFVQRSKRPPRDPINALLSYGYTILAHRCAGALEAVGLDPCMGVFHEVRAGRNSLALDVMEPLRAPLVDHFVWNCVNRRIFKAGGFAYTAAVGSRMDAETRRSFLIELDKWWRTEGEPGRPNGLRPILAAQHLANAFRGCHGQGQ